MNKSCYLFLSVKKAAGDYHSNALPSHRGCNQLVKMLFSGTTDLVLMSGFDRVSGQGCLCCDTFSYYSTILSPYVTEAV